MGHSDILLKLDHIGVENLEANRAGVLSQRQAGYFRRNGIRSVILALIIVGVLAAVLFGVAAKPLVPIQWILTAGLSAIVLVIGYNDYSKLRLTAADPSLSVSRDSLASRSAAVLAGISPLPTETSSCLRTPGS